MDRRRMLMLKKQGELPQGYTKVDYLESTGTQGIILTNIIPTNKLQVDITFALTNLAYDWTSNNHFVIAKYQANDQRFRPLKITSGKYFEIQDKNANSLYQARIDLNKHNLIFNDINHYFSWDKNKIGRNVVPNAGITSPDGTGIGVFAQGQNFGLYPTSFTAMRLYSLEFRDNTNDELIDKFICCLDEDSKPCLYGTISKNTFYNVGTGEFLYGWEE